VNIARYKHAIRGNLSDQVLCNPPPTHYAWTSGKPVLRLAGAIAFAAVGFLVTCCLVRPLIRDPIGLYAEIRSEKLALARQWAGVASIAAFGSSHVDCGFDPRAFDAAFSSPTKHPVSLNLGVAGGSQIEQTAVAREYERQVAASGAPATAHVLLLEANSGVNFTGKFMTHPRSINIYDANALRLALQFSDPKLGRVRALGRSLVAIGDYLLNFMNVGMLSSQIFPAQLNAALVGTQTTADRRGLSPPPPSPMDVRDTRDIHTLVESLPPKPSVSPAVLTPGLCAEARSLVQDAKGTQTYRIVYFVTPKLTDLRSYDTYPQTITCGGLVIPIIDVALPAENPGLYDISLWHDINHLNERGAGVYSKLLGRALKGALGQDISAIF
jgi:hypothetical protein